MLKEYAVALVLSTATPVAADKQEVAKQAPESQKETITQPQTVKLTRWRLRRWLLI